MQGDPLSVQITIQNHLRRVTALVHKGRAITNELAQLVRSKDLHPNTTENKLALAEKRIKIITRDMKNARDQLCLSRDIISTLLEHFTSCHECNHFDFDLSKANVTQLLTEHLDLIEDVFTLEGLLDHFQRLIDSVQKDIPPPEEDA